MEEYDDEIDDEVDDLREDLTQGYAHLKFLQLLMNKSISAVKTNDDDSDF